MVATAAGKKDILKSIRERRFLNKDFAALRADLLEYARTFYADRINDFSEASMGGVLLDFAAYTGDVMSFYLDHQFGELDPSTAVEDINIERQLNSAGVDIVGSAAAVVDESFFIEVPAIQTSDGFSPDPRGMATILRDTVLLANNGVTFNLTEDIDFSQVDSNGNLMADVIVGDTNASNEPTSFIMSRKELCLSGRVVTETFSIGSFTPFRQIRLSNPSVTQIISVSDSDGNVYYEVDSLTQDVVFRGITNVGPDNKLVEENLELLPAPYRFTTATSLSGRFTTLTFGGGDGASLEDDIIPDPSEFAIPLYGKKTFTRFSLDPNRLLSTPTLGVAKSDTTLSIVYRYGGGLNHNVDSDSINEIDTLFMRFPDDTTATIAAAVRTSTDVTNLDRSRGGDDPPTIDELKDLIPSARNAQKRVVSKPDLLARVYTIPTNFGRVFRAGVRSAPNNPLTSQLFIISRDQRGQLSTSPDALKKNLRTYLNSFRLVSDAIDILDAGIVNIGVDFEIVTDMSANKTTVLQEVLTRVKNYFKVTNFNIDQPIILSDVRTAIYNHLGVVAVNDLRIRNISGERGGREYSSVLFDIRANTRKGLIIPPAGHIFEVKFAESDIAGVAI